jgi:hypothetical protein
MPRIAMPGIFCLAIVLALLSPSFMQAQPPKENTPAPAPLPAQIVSAKKVFIANAGQENNPNAGKFGEYSGGMNRTYNQFYSAVKNWGHYELASNPADCDLVFEIGFTDAMVGARVFKGDSVGPVDEPKFRLVILDPKTHIVLWAFTEHVEWANLQGHRDKNFDQALAKLVDDVKSLATQPGVEANK